MFFFVSLEFTPNDCDERSRSLYLMALDFRDKHKWVATLEAIVNHGSRTDRLKNAVTPILMKSNY